MENGSKILKMDGISKSFYGVRVLNSISLDLNRGEILGLVGENGAGKSTLMNILGGVHPKDSGEMEVDGQLYEPQTPRDAQRVNIAFIHQELNLFSNMSVAENLFIDGYPTGIGGVIKKKEMLAKTQEYLDQYGLSVNPETKIETLPMGTRQMIEVVKALTKDARILIFDEPTTSLSQREKDKLFATIKEIQSQGISIIYISHILEDVFLLSDRIAVLRDGNMIGVKPKDSLETKDVIHMMVGRDMNQIYPTVEEREIGETVLKVNNLTRDPAVKGVSLDLKAGEIVGLYGLMGAGRTEFVRALFGADKMDSGEVYIFGEKIDRPTPTQSIASGISFVTEDRRLEGLLMPKPVYQNLTLVILEQLSGRLGVIDKKGEVAAANDMIDRLSIRVAKGGKLPASSLSGGNQQKVVFGKWLMKDPKILILDEPTRGVDVGAKLEIYNIICEMASRGLAVLMVSSEMEELIGVCDRILVMKRGVLSGEVVRKHYSQEAILTLAI